MSMQVLRFFALLAQKIYDREMKRRFKPPLAPTLVTLLMLTVMIGLGTWQLQRLAWKTQKLAQIESRMRMPAVPMPDTLDKPDDWEYRRVTLAGHFIHGHEFLVKPRTLDGVNGSHMLVPFERASGSIVMVNRGWISEALLPKASRPAGLIQIEGTVQKPRVSYFTPSNNPEKGLWYWADLPVMAATAKLAMSSPVLVQIVGRVQDVYPVGSAPDVNIRNNHKQYAIFWYTMALVLLFIFFIRYWNTNENIPKA